MGTTGTFEGIADDTSYLYNSGTISSLCGGFNSYEKESYNSNITLTKASSYLEINATQGTGGYGYGCWYNTKSVLITNHKYLNMKFSIVSCSTNSSSVCNFYGCLSSSSSQSQSGSNIVNKYMNLKSYAGTVTAIIDISSVTGYYYFGFTLNCDEGGDAVIRMSQIWLSKS